MASTQPTDAPPAGAAFTHQTSRRVTAGISFHSFHTSPGIALDRWLRPTQNVTLQFPEDLDPVGGRHGLSAEDRRCTFTPCHLDDPAALPSENTNDKKTVPHTCSLALLTRNGRITGLLGLPRPYQELTAQAVNVGGGFPFAALDPGTVGQETAETRAGAPMCIAGGTGIAPFLTMGAESTRRHCLCWSIRGDDFGAVEFVLKEKLLRVDRWAAVTVFVTAGEDTGGLAVEKPGAWWQAQFEALRGQYSDGLRLEKRRMTAGDVTAAGAGHDTKILFCGSKSLEWQVRMWSMGSAVVYCTEML